MHTFVLQNIKNNRSNVQNVYRYICTRLYFQTKVKP
jgi:hypothetical protein